MKYPPKPPFCQIPFCGRTGHIDWHHITPRSQGGGNELSNLVALCHACHTAHHQVGGQRITFVREEGLPLYAKRGSEGGFVRSWDERTESA